MRRMNYFKPTRKRVFRITGLLFIILLALKNPFISCTSSNSAFYEKVLKDFDSTSYFIAIDVKSPSYKGRTIIENKNLYQFLNQTKGFHNERYLPYMENMLTHHRALKIEEKDFFKWNFRKVHDIESVIKNANHGMNNFVAFYFNGRVLNSILTEDEQNAVISQLFYWGIPAKIDKLTGELIIG
jgi:hypothetical protein